MRIGQFWPRSTLGRSLLLLSILLLGSQGLIYFLFHNYVLEPAAQRFAQILWQADRVSSSAATPPFAQVPWRYSVAMHGSPPRSFFLRQSARYFARTAPGAELRSARQGGKTWLWMRARLGEPWVGIPIEDMVFSGNPFTLARVLIIALLTLVGAWLIVRQINRPLARLAASTPRILRGELGDYPVSCQAPSEIQELERTIAGMADDLHRLHDERTLLLTGISHELRTPLSRLMLSLHLSDQALLEQKPAMLADVQEMDEVIGNFLAWVQGGSTERTVAVNLVEWAEDMVSIARERYALLVETQISGADCAFSCRPMALERVFRNLFDNVRRYGGGYLTFAATCSADSVNFSLLDRGSGMLTYGMLSAMNAGLLPKQPGHGSGMGLRICHRLLSLHRGSLHFAASPSGGLRTEISLPR